MGLLTALFIFMAHYSVILPPIALLVLLFTKGRNESKKIIVYSLVSAAFVMAIALIASSLYYNPRPFVIDNSTPLIPHSSNNGFPSDHTLFSAMFSFIIIPFSPVLGTLSLILTFIIGALRVYAGVHHVLDIIAAILISLAGCCLSYFLVISFFKTLDKKKNK